MGYGNAIVRPLAVAFVQSAIDAIADAAEETKSAAVAAAEVTDEAVPGEAREFV